MTVMVYLARPVDLDQLTDVQLGELSRTKKNLINRGALVYDPAAAFAVRSGVPPSKAIVEVNSYAVLQADALVAFWPEARTVGVPMEIQLALSAGKPVLVVSSVADESWSLAHLPTVRSVTPQDLSALIQQAQEQPKTGLEDVIKVKVQPGSMLPSRSYLGDCGFDLTVSEDIEIEPDSFVDVPCGVAIELPDGVWGLITGRSSTLRKHNLLVALGVIDTGYRGPLFAGVRNMDSENTFYARKGMRLAQLIPLPNNATYTRMEEVERLAGSDRGEAGFGSSGS